MTLGKHETTLMSRFEKQMKAVELGHYLYRDYDLRKDILDLCELFFIAGKCEGVDLLSEKLKEI